jgi:hypothetical protein
VTYAYPASWAGFRDLAEAQARVLSRSQLRECGVTRRAIRKHLMAGRWRLAGPRVVVLHTGELTRLQSWWVGILHAGRSACLAGLSASEAAGLIGWEREATHVLVPKGARIPRLPGVIVHESRRFGPADIHPVRRPPQTRIARSLVDAAVWMADAGAGCGLLAAGVQQRLTRIADLQAALDQAGQVRHKQIMRQALADIDGGAHSLAEIDLVRLCRRYGLQRPTYQQYRSDAAGRRRYLDAVWAFPGGEPLSWRSTVDCTSASVTGGATWPGNAMW